MKELKAWVARDEDGMLFLYFSEPSKSQSKWIPTCHRFTDMNKELFPEVKWEDEEATEVTITIKK